MNVKNILKLQLLLFSIFFIYGCNQQEISFENNTYQETENLDTIEKSPDYNIEEFIPKDQIGTNLKVLEFKLITEKEILKNLNIPYELVKGFHKEYVHEPTNIDLSLAGYQTSGINFDKEVLGLRLKNMQKKEKVIENKEVNIYYSIEDKNFEYPIAYIWNHGNLGFMIIGNFKESNVTKYPGEEIFKEVILMN